MEKKIIFYEDMEEEMSEGENYYKWWRKFSSFASWYIRQKIFVLFMEKIFPTSKDRVLDLGITADLLHKADNYFEKLYPFPNKITGAGVEDLSRIKEIYSEMEFVQADGLNLPFGDASFDILFSGAVLEHVGSRQNQEKFASEVSRVGKKFFITTPNRNFPLEVHTGLPFLHWLPDKIYRKILKFLGLNFFAEEKNLNLIGKREFRRLFRSDKGVEIFTIKLMGLPLILVAVKS